MVAVGLLVIVSACGSATEPGAEVSDPGVDVAAGEVDDIVGEGDTTVPEGDPLASLFGNADLELWASVVPAASGDFAVEIVVRALDESFVNGPRVSFELPEGLRLLERQECVAAAAGFECAVAPFLQSLDSSPATSDPFVVEFTGTGPTTVVFSVTSQENPLDEDRDASNNVVEVVLQ